MGFYKNIGALRSSQPKSRYISVEKTAFAFLDIETTGLYPERGSRIIEIAILSRNNPRFLFNETASTITDKKLAQQLPLLSNYLQSGVIVGHNVNFDLQFIAYEADRLGCRGPNVLFIDTLQLAKRLCIDIQDHRLLSLIKFFNISTNGPLHRAEIDARCTRALFWKLINKGGIETLSQAGIKQLNWSTF